VIPAAEPTVARGRVPVEAKYVLQMLALPSHALFAIHEDWAARLVGQWRLLVLAR